MSGQDENDPLALSTHVPPVGLSVLAEVEAYWRSLMHGGRLPARADVDPTSIDAALPHAFILERVAPAVARLRVAGQALSAHLGAEARGMPLSSFFEAASRPTLATHLNRVFDEPALIDLGLTCTRGPFRSVQGGRLLMLPLLGEDGRVTRALGALLIDGATGKTPRRFEIPPDATLRAEAFIERPTFAAVASGGGSTGLRYGLAEAERPWLRLVVSNT